MRPYVILFALAALSLAACETSIHCGAFVYSPEEGRCTCPPGFIENEDFTNCVPIDGGLGPDGGTGDAGACVPTTETCNGIDDDCDGVVDGPAAAVACGARDRAAVVECVAGECVVGTCLEGFGDCDADAENGCELQLDTLEHCGSCGTSCGWQCDGGTCNDAVEISAATDHQCVLLSSGRAACWGANERGQLGNGAAGASARRDAPAYVLGAAGTGHLSGLVQLVTGSTHTCARASDGQLWCWGANDVGQLNDGTRADRAFPVRVLGVSRVVDFSVGASHTCAVLESGSVMCWGANDRGQLGIGNTFERTGPVAVEGVSSAVAVSGMSSTTCARLSDRGVRCWGSNLHGALGNDRADSMNLPVSPIGVSDVDQLVVGGAHACVLRGGGALWCWGSNYNGQFSGLYGYGAHPVPFELTTAPSPAQVFMGTGETFLVNGAGDAFELLFSGYEAIADEGPVRDVAFGENLCLITDQGAARCRSHPDEPFFAVSPPP